MPGGFDFTVDQAAVEGLVTGPEVHADLQARGERGKEMAQRLAPVVSGRLRDEIDLEVGDEGGQPYVDLVSPVVNPEDGFAYGLLVEVEEPYLRPAVDAMVIE